MSAFSMVEYIAFSMPSVTAAEKKLFSLKTLNVFAIRENKF